MATPGELIREAREAAGLNKVQLADRLGKNDGSLISRLENGEMSVSRDMYNALITELRTLRPADLLNAMGYPVTVRGADRLPVGLVADLLALPSEELEAVAVLVRRRARPDHPARAQAHS